MGVTVRQKVPGKGQPWWVFVAHNNRRTSRMVGSKEAAQTVASKIEAQLKLGEFEWEKKGGKRSRNLLSRSMLIHGSPQLHLQRARHQPSIAILTSLGFMSFLYLGLSNWGRSTEGRWRTFLPVRRWVLQWLAIPWLQQILFKYSDITYLNRKRWIPFFHRLKG